MSKSEGDFVAGFFMGALVGAVMALLFAPRPGKDLRRELRERSIVLKDRAEEMGWDPGQMTAAVKSKGQAFLEEQRARLQAAVQEGRDAAARKKEELLHQIEHPDDETAPSEAV